MQRSDARPATELRDTLRSIDGRNYKAYHAVLGEYVFPGFRLTIDHVQGDPFAAPSRLRVAVPQSRAQFPPECFPSHVRRVALEDYIARQFAAAIRRFVRGERGMGKSGLIAVDCGRQEILERTACKIDKHWVEVRFVVGLPAEGRTCLGQQAAVMFFDELPRVVEAAMYYPALDAVQLARHVAVAEDATALREQLTGRGLVAFIADDAILPRASGVSDRPLSGGVVVPFASPPELRLTLPVPNKGAITGMGIPEGVTLIVGGGYHGKSTLLRAIERGVYNHIPGDGREYVVARADAVTVRAEDGRRVAQVDISPFIDNLPFEQNTAAFSTENASGSTSQAANIVEAIEAGASLLLIDEDTSAANFMIRDARMQRLVAKQNEPITPFVDHVRNLRERHGVSTIIVMGGSGDYFDVADDVICMQAYVPRLVTAEAKLIVAELPTRRAQESGAVFGALTQRVPLPQSINPTRRGRTKVDARGTDAIRFGNEDIDLQDVEQLVDPSQTEAIGDMLVYALQRGYLDGRATLREVLSRVFADVSRAGLDVISPFHGQHPGNYALPRLQEVAAALNRLRTLTVTQVRS